VQITNRADWQQANPVAIARALSKARSKPDGGWFVVDATRTIRRSAKPRGYVVNDAELVAWNESAHTIRVAPGACPHMGAHLGEAKVQGGCLVCPWHGLELGATSTAKARRDWEPFRTYDDGVLTWVQFKPDDPAATDQPFLPTRPDVFMEGVIRRDAKCEPRDIIANRLDPWHGAHFHPYAFTRLEVTDHNDDELHLRVAYKVLPGYEIEVGARFECPDPRTIVMTITDGEGIGSVVETHATPLRSAQKSGGPRTTVIEATLATSDRAGFVHAQRGAAIARPIIKAIAARLWRDDARYAERLYQLRSRDHRGAS
jgi:phenylpropionate dioxygenase-like ring-hydroxylating dioxygenase large terminal subunit